MKQIFTHLMTWVYLVSMFSCQSKEEIKPNEQSGPLQGTWSVFEIYPVQYDQQNKAITTFNPINTIGYTQLKITENELQYFDQPTNNYRNVQYQLTGNKISCQPPELSYTIIKQTELRLELNLAGEYTTSGNQTSRIDYTIYLNRK